MKERRGGDVALILKTAGAIVGIALICLVSFSCGSIVGEIRTTRRFLDEQRDAVNPVLGRDPAYADVRIASYDDGGWIILEGEVPTEADKFRLMRDVTQAVGQKKAENAVPGVRVKNPPPGR